MKMLEGKDEDHAATTRTAWNVTTLVHVDDRPRLDAAVKDHLEGRTPSFECEYRVEQRNGDWHWLLSRGRCLRDTAGRPHPLLRSATDAEGQKKTQAAQRHPEGQAPQTQKQEADGTTGGGT